MRCPSCGCDNRPDRKFCAECGQPLAVRCEACGNNNQPGERYCGECGQPLANTPVIPFLPTQQHPSPTSFANGRYQVVRFLGEGGKKRVYLAHDTLLDRDVAFALIKTEGLDAEGRERITREAQAMGKMGTHPHIVSVFDMGQEGDSPYLVTELMVGGDVEGLIEKAEDHRLPIERAVEIAQQVCRGLEFAHSQGLVHRDLKPGNVWLTADGIAKIGDFGLAVALDRSRLTQAGMMVGTVAYMPPEQAMGGAITPRSDLYALGAMLYEMVCGRPPFLGDDSVSIIGQHLNTAPVAPSWHRPELPAGLEPLVLRLLEKDPSKRPISAGKIHDSLASLTLVSHPEPGVQRAETVNENPLYRRVFVGREAELKQLQGAFDAALSGQAGMVMVVGEPGIGKTSVAEQLATYAGLRGGNTLVGHCYEEGSHSLPYLAFVEALRSYVLDRDPAGLREDLGAGASEVARIVSEVRDRVQVSPSDIGDPEEQRWRLLHAVATFLRNASTVRPLLLVLEDLHDADRGTLDLLVHLARNLQGARLLIVGTYRDVEVDRAHPLSSVLAELRRSNAFTRVALRGLTIDEVNRMMNLIRGQEVQWSRAEAIHRQTEGNPLFVQEVLRYLVEEGLVVREGGRYVRADDGTPDTGIPEGLRDVIGKRLSRLSDKANQVLSIASVIGREFRLDVLEKVVGLPEEEVIDALEEAQERAVIEDRGALGGALTLRFTHAFFRQTLYEEIFSARRIRWHQQLARALEDVHARRLDEHAAELAEHYAHSSDPADLAKAVSYGERAAQRAMSVYAYGEAARHIEQALKAQEVLDPDDETRKYELLLALAEALLPSEEPRRAEGVAAEAFSAAENLKDVRRAIRAALIAIEGLIRTFSVNSGATWRAPEMQEWMSRVDRLTTAGTPDRVRADVYLAISTAATTGVLDRRRLRETLERAQEISPDPVFFLVASECLRVLNTVEDRPRMHQLAVDLLDRPSRDVRSMDLRPGLMEAGGLLMEMGDRERAEKAWSELDRLADRTQDATLKVASLTPQVTLAFIDGRLGDAWNTFRTQLQLGREAGAAGILESARCWHRAVFHLGRLDVVLRGLDDPAPMVQLQRSVFLAHAGSHDEARAIVNRLPYLELPDDDLSIVASAWLLEIAILQRDVAAITRWSERLTPLAPYPFAANGFVAYSRLLGDAAIALDRAEQARGYYESGIRMCQTIRFRPEIALSQLGLAEVLLQHYPDERTEATRYLDLAIQACREMKMQPSLERALRHRELLSA